MLYATFNILYNITVYPVIILLITLLLKTFFLLRYYNYNYQRIRDLETKENYPRIGY